MASLNASVGRDGVNQFRDTRLIQGLLNLYKIPGATVPLKVDGDCSVKTIKRIELFQKKILHFARPDGRVDPDGRSFKILIKRTGTKVATAYSFSKKASDLLKSIEGLRLKPYDDQTSKEISAWVSGATIGYGHLIVRREWPTYKDGINRTSAEALFKTDLTPFVERVRDRVTAYITQNEFDALVFLTFNIGVGAFSRSSVLRLVNNPGAVTDYPGMEQAWKAWNKSQQRYNRGLANRRKAEWDIYTKGVYRRW